MGVSFEPVNGWLARLGAEHYFYGDPYTAVVVIENDKGVAKIKGFAGKVSSSLIKDGLRKVCSELGLSSYKWDRVKNGKFNTVYRKGNTMSESKYKVVVQAVIDDVVYTHLEQYFYDNYEDFIRYQGALANGAMNLGFEAAEEKE